MKCDVVETIKVEEKLREEEENMKFYRVQKVKKRVPAWFVEYAYSTNYQFNRKTSFWKIAVRKYVSVERQIFYVEYNLLYLMYKDFLKKRKKLSKSK